MKLFIILFGLGYFIPVYAQPSFDEQAVDRTALAIPAAQTNTTADIATYINTHFTTDNKKVRAIYTWVAANIRYSLDSLHPVIFEEDRDQRIAIALHRRKGVCENYASIFNDICIKSGLKSLLVEGYTKQGGSMDRSPHAWCTVFIDNAWRLYDPTWDEDRAHRGAYSGSIDYAYFEALPEAFIQSHMPFDPMFQLLNYPVSYKEFYNGNTVVNRKNSFFNYADSIAQYQRLNPLDKYLSTASRIEKNGTPTSSMIYNKQGQLKMDIEIIYQDKDTALYNAAIADYNNALAMFNSFLTYRNNQFTPAKADSEIQSIFQNAEKEITSARLKLKEVNHSKAVLALNTAPLEKALSDLSTHITEQQSFLKDYLSQAKEK